MMRQNWKCKFETQWRLEALFTRGVLKVAERIRVAIIGCGSISRAHARGYLQSLDLFEVFACCDERRELAEERAQQLGAKLVAPTTVKLSPTTMLTLLTFAYPITCMRR